MDTHIFVKEDRKKSSLWISETELSILQAVADGKTSKEIAKDRKRTYQTVEAQRYNVLKRLGCRNMPHLIALLFREKILK